MVLQIFWIVFLLFIWFNTDAFIQYSKLFKLENIFKIKEWNNYRIENNPRLTYLEYLNLKHYSFLTKLISCRPCLTFWLTLLTCLVFKDLVLFPIIYMLSYIIYKIIDRYV